MKGTSHLSRGYIDYLVPLVRALLSSADMTFLNFLELSVLSTLHLASSSFCPRQQSLHPVRDPKTTLQPSHLDRMPPNKGGNAKKEAGRAKKADNEVCPVSHSVRLLSKSSAPCRNPGREGTM